MVKVPVKSSNIKAIGYDEGTQELEIDFEPASTYIYSAVPKELHEKFMLSESKGKFFHANIRGKFAVRRYFTPSTTFPREHTREVRF